MLQGVFTHWMAERLLYDPSGDFLFLRGLSWVAVGLCEEAGVFSLISRLRANEHKRMRAEEASGFKLLSRFYSSERERMRVHASEVRVGNTVRAGEGGAHLQKISYTPTGALLQPPPRMFPSRQVALMPKFFHIC